VGGRWVCDSRLYGFKIRNPERLFTKGFKKFDNPDQSLFRCVFNDERLSRSVSFKLFTAKRKTQRVTATYNVRERKRSLNLYSVQAYHVSAYRLRLFN